jgi:hypothetical protein
MGVSFDDRGLLDASTREYLSSELSPLTTLEQVVRWGFGNVPPRPVLDVVVQDEYTHDVVMLWRAPLHLVFDTT